MTAEMRRYSAMLMMTSGRCVKLNSSSSYLVLIANLKFSMTLLISIVVVLIRHQYCDIGVLVVVDHECRLSLLLVVFDSCSLFV